MSKFITLISRHRHRRGRQPEKRILKLAKCSVTEVNQTWFRAAGPLLINKSVGLQCNHVIRPTKRSRDFCPPPPRPTGIKSINPTCHPFEVRNPSLVGFFANTSSSSVAVANNNTSVNNCRNSALQSVTRSPFRLCHRPDGLPVPQIYLSHLSLLCFNLCIRVLPRKYIYGRVFIIRQVPLVPPVPLNMTHSRDLCKYNAETRGNG